MFRTSFRCLCVAALLAYTVAFAFSQERSDKQTPLVASDGQIEITEIRIARVRVSDASPKADLTNMMLALWIDVKDTDARQFLVRLVSLEPIVDDTGKTLSTDKRRSEIDFLREETRTREFRSARNRKGPVIRMTLDAPASRASKIKAIKGRIELFATGSETITLKNLPSLVDKRIKHKSLSEIKIVPRINKVFGDSTEVALSVSGKQDRLIDWTVVHNGRQLFEDSMSKSSNRDSATILGKAYRRFQPDENTSLLIKIATAKKKQTIDFEFTDVELP